MPQIYNRIPTPPTVTERHRSSSVSSASSSSSSSSLSDTPRPTDVDDSIVLSDLVRTGEASRLRRRGAMRLDHGHHNGLGYPYTAPRETSPTPWDSDDELGVVTYPHRQRRFSYSRRRRLEEEESEVEDYRYTLVCGAEIEQSGLEDPCEPWTPSFLPVPPPTSSSTPQIRRQRKTNGCGAILHLRAAPRPRAHMWTARTVASSCVVPLEAQYFDAAEAAKFERSSCGCVKEGVGCAVCGNPLGTRYIPCRMAASGMFSPGHKHYTSLQAPWTSDPQPQLPMRPEGPRYWHAMPSSSRSTFHVHSFFSTAVTSYPEYKFPPKGTSPVPFTSNNITVQEPSTMYFDRPITSSPSPFESSSFRDRESSSPRNQDPSMLRTHEPTPSSGSSFYQQTTPPSFYQQQILTAWDREREQTRRPTPGVGRRRRETWNGFENDNDQVQDADTDVGGWGVWGGGLGNLPMGTGGVGGDDGWTAIDEEDLQWRGEGAEGHADAGAGEDEEEGEGVDKGESGDGMWLER